MSDQRNKRETGARSLPAKTDADANDDFSQDAAANRKPPGGMGNAEPIDDLNEKTRHYDGQILVCARLHRQRKSSSALDQHLPNIRKTPKRLKADATLARM